MRSASGFMKGCGFQDVTSESVLDKSALMIGDLCPPIFPEAAVHASAPYWALTIVQELRLMALIFTPLITGLMVCL